MKIKLKLDKEVPVNNYYIKPIFRNDNFKNWQVIVNPNCPNLGFLKLITCWISPIVKRFAHPNDMERLASTYHERLGYLIGLNRKQKVFFNKP
jgi:hypothetical protein